MMMMVLLIRRQWNPLCLWLSNTISSWINRVQINPMTLFFTLTPLIYVYISLYIFHCVVFRLRRRRAILLRPGIPSWLTFQQKKSWQIPVILSQVTWKPCLRLYYGCSDPHAILHAHLYYDFNGTGFHESMFLTPTYFQYGQLENLDTVILTDLKEHLNSFLILTTSQKNGWLPSLLPRHEHNIFFQISFHTEHSRTQTPRFTFNCGLWGY